MPVWQRLLAVAKKEFLELRRNKLLLMILILGPLAIYLLNAYGVPVDINNLSLGILDEDNSVLSRDLADNLGNSRILKITQRPRNQEQLIRALNLSELRAGAVIPDDFSAKLLKGSPVTVQALVDGAYPNFALISAGYIEGAVYDFNFDLLENYAKRTGSQYLINSPIDIKTAVWYNPTFNGDYFNLPGLFGLALVFFPAVMAALSITKEKETHSILNFYCSSVTKTEYLLGKMLPYIIITYCQCWVCLAHAVLIARIPMRGSLSAWATAALFFSAASVGLGLFIGVLAQRQSASILITTIVTLTLTFSYSGVLIPVMCLSEDSRVIAYLLPATHFIDLSRKILIQGAGWLTQLPNIAFLFGACLAVYGGSILIFKKRLG